MGWIGGLLKDKIQQLREKFMAMGAWESSGDAESMWSKTTKALICLHLIDV